MKELTQRTVNKMCREHEKWLADNSTGKRADFSFRKGSYLSFYGRNLSQAIFENSNLTSCLFAKANLTLSDFEKSNLAFNDFSEANLTKAELSLANIVSCYFTLTSLHGVAFIDSLVKYNDFTKAKFYSNDFSGTRLLENKGLLYASCSWTDHGERGRTLLAILINKEVTYYCGCFNGSEADLRVYIKQTSPNLAGSRLTALEFCAARIKEMQEARSY